jgi:hypothetical protein
MKKILWAILILSLISCKPIKENKHSDYHDEFYLALNELLKSEFPNVRMIVDETLPVFNNYGNYPKPISKGEEPPPPPPPPGIVYYTQTIFDLFTLQYSLDSSDVRFMYKSIDSTKKILIDPLRVTLKVIEQKKMQEIFSQKAELFSDKWKIFRETFGEGCFIEISTPIFNSTFTKLIITIKKHCGPPDGEDYNFILEKLNDKWRIMEGKYDITTDLNEKSTKT